MKRLAFFLLALSCSFVYAAPPESAATQPSQSSLSEETVAQRYHITKIWAFGDSLTDTGNKKVVNEHYDANRATNVDEATSQGKVWVEYFAESLGLPAPTPSGHPGTLQKFSGGTNYAVMGGKALKGNYDDVPNQIAAYLANHKPEPTDLFCISGGSNDAINHGVLNSITRLEPQGISDLQKKKLLNSGQEDKIARSLLLQVTRLLNAGAKRVMIQAVPDLGMTPAAALGGMQKELSAWAERVNQDLESGVEELRDSHDANLIYIDTFDIMHDLYDRHRDYGFKTFLASYCVSNPERTFWFRTYAGASLLPFNTDVSFKSSECMFWDLIHPTTKGHQCIAELIFQEFCKQLETVPAE